jgi:hypothetical protein
VRPIGNPEEIVNLIKKDISNGTLFQQQLPASVTSSESSDEDISLVQKNKLSINDSQLIRAKWLIENKKVVHVPQCKAFNVLNESDEPYLIRLYPSPTCTCKARSKCCHIMAVQLSLGIEIKENKPIPNLSKLRRNNKNGKLTGRKMRGHKK